MLSSSFGLLAGLLDSNGLKIMRTLIYKIPPALPFPKRGIPPYQRGRQGVVEPLFENNAPAFRLGGSPEEIGTPS
jgi:hypothetical protein